MKSGIKNTCVKFWAMQWLLTMCYPRVSNIKVRLIGSLKRNYSKKVSYITFYDYCSSLEKFSCLNAQV